MKAITVELRCESDRGCLLVGAAAIDYALELALRTRIKRGVGLADVASRKKTLDQLFAVERPLSSLSAKITFAHALGMLLDDMYKQLEGIRKLRNEFAHDYLRASFGDLSVRRRVGQLFCDPGFVPPRRGPTRNIVVRVIALNVGILRGFQVAEEWADASMNQSAPGG